MSNRCQFCSEPTPAHSPLCPIHVEHMRRCEHPSMYDRPSAWSKDGYVSGVGPVHSIVPGQLASEPLKRRGTGTTDGVTLQTADGPNAGRDIGSYTKSGNYAMKFTAWASAGSGYGWFQIASGRTEQECEEFKRSYLLEHAGRGGQPMRTMTCPEGTEPGDDGVPRPIPVAAGVGVVAKEHLRGSDQGNEFGPWSGSSPRLTGATIHADR